ncbi:EVE domain-containing protein [Polaribacter sp. HaHaR_3_91]|uniref:AAA family ATPase n=1 Tax=Polaribacter sp. HaHaR_3_91 TaxID=2745561 RepID=UPI001C4F4BD5|nr:EVE domain-containing protein [Polaribacter sp. HaHaR_3_91]QXP63230.1 EVE domain-containing protein [Polaribacter sp. HaHaR_3_91]
MLFEKVNKEHIIQGIKDFGEKGIPKGFGASSTYDLVYNGIHYPPKTIMAYANFHAEGRTIEPYFKGGLNTDCFNVFEKLQFNVIKKQLTDPIFQIQVSKTTDGNFLTAQLQIVKGGYQLLKGSYIYKEPKPSFLIHSYYKMRVKYENEDYFEDSDYSKYVILKKNITFDKSSPAAVIVLNRAANGKREWKLKDGTTLEEFENKQVKPLKQINYWVFQGNPKIYNTTAALKSGHLKSWKVAAHKDKIAIGDKVIIWQTGKDAGCYALAEVTSEVGVFEEEKFEEQYYIDKSNSLATVRVKIKIEHSFADTPILWKDIKNRAIFSNFKAGNQGTNFSATKEEYQELTNMINSKNLSINTKLNYLIQDYKSALINDNWLYVELYKFEWANWLTERVVFEEQTDEEILELCLASQNENYTDSKGVQFIKQGAREKLSKYIGIEDIKIFRDFYNRIELENIDYSNRNMSFPILSCWMSVLVPNSIFPASRTSFADIIRKVFVIKLRSSNIDFVINMQKPMETICNVLLENKEVVDFVSKQLNKSELSQLDLNWLTQDFLLFIDRHPNLLKPITETVEEEEEQYIMLEKMPTNQILYGPPGTGKTFYLKDQLFDRYTLKENAITKEKFFEDKITNLTWWQVIAIALIENGTSKVNEILENRWVKTKASLSESKNVRATIWGTLQMHTITSSENVAYKQRQNPLIFDKNNDKMWQLLEEETKEQIPEIYDIIDEVNNFKSNNETVIKNYDFVTFHQSFAYEDFIEGIKPVFPETEEETKDLGYKIEDGVFKKLCIKAKNDPSNRYAIFIDEINRGNVSAIFGELITLIETDKRSGAKNEMSIKLPYSKKEFSVPSNLDIYGTMNTADRSVEALDTALRRRFEFKEMMPDYTVIENEEVDYIKLSEVLKKINERIELLIDRDHAIGHSYFCKVNSEEKLAKAFNTKIVPLLQEYFYGDYGKIGLVLGKGFVEKEKNDAINFADFSYENSNDFKAPSYLLKQVNEDNVIEAVLSLLGKKQAE